MKKLISVFIFLVIFSACTPSPEAIQTAIEQTQSVWTDVPTQTPYPTLTPWIVTKIVTQIVKQTIVIPPSETPTPIYTPTITGTPTLTPNVAQTATAAQIIKLKKDFGDGNYLVGVDIAPGVWRNNGTRDDCYWSRETRTGNIIDNYLGLGGGTAYISSNDFLFHSQDCGVWTWLSAP